MKNRLPSLVKKAEPVRHQFSSSSSSSSLDTMSIIEAILSASAKGRRTRRFRSALGFRQTRFGSRLPVRPRALGGNDEEARIPRRLFAALLRFRYALTLRLSRLIRYCRVNLSSARTPESLPDESVATVCADASFFECRTQSSAARTVSRSGFRPASFEEAVRRKKCARSSQPSLGTTPRAGPHLRSSSNYVTAGQRSATKVYPKRCG